MLFLAAGIAVFRIKVPSSEAATLVGAGLTGIGLGATVAPALFVAGFSLPAPGLQRVFAIIELMRGVAAFMIAPVFVHFARDRRREPQRGRRHRAVDRSGGSRLGGAVIAVMVYVLGGARPDAADIDLFLKGKDPRVRLAATAGESPHRLAPPEFEHPTSCDGRSQLTWYRRTPSTEAVATPDSSGAPGLRRLGARRARNPGGPALSSPPPGDVAPIRGAGVTFRRSW